MTRSYRHICRDNARQYPHQVRLTHARLWRMDHMDAQIRQAVIDAPKNAVAPPGVAMQDDVIESFANGGHDMHSKFVQLGPVGTSRDQLTGS